VPTPVLHGDDDQSLQIAPSALSSSKIIKNARLVIYKGAPHGICTTLKDRVNAELLAFIKD
jgi:non-heme chloroperoxidase